MTRAPLPFTIKPPLPMVVMKVGVTVTVPAFVDVAGMFIVKEPTATEVTTAPAGMPVPLIAAPTCNPVVVPVTVCDPSVVVMVASVGALAVVMVPDVRIAKAVALVFSVTAAVSTMSVAVEVRRLLLL